MAGKLKVDLSGVKSFLVERGEKIALVLCALAAGLLITMGVLDAASVRNAPGSDKPYALAMQSAATNLKSKVENAPLDPQLMDDPANKFVPLPWEWNPANPLFQFGEFFGMADSGSTKRLNPRVVPVVAGADTCTMSYIAGSYFALDIEKQNQKITVFEPPANAGGPAVAPIGPGGKNKGMLNNAHPAIVTKPVRMVVVHCVFPMQEQLKAFQDAFRMQNQAELWASKDLPRVLGLNIWKAEVVPGKAVKWEPMVVTENKGGEMKLTVDPALRKLFREAYLDDDMNLVFLPFLMQGLAMPLPKLATLPAGLYPPVKLAGLELDENMPVPAGFGIGGGGAGGGGGIPDLKAFNPFGKNAVGGGGGMVAGGGNIRNTDFPWRNLSKNLQDKLNDRTNVLDPLLVNFDSDDEKKDENVAPGVQNMNESFFQGASKFAAQNFWGMYPKPAMPVIPGKETTKKGVVDQVYKPYDALVRFVDPTVEPGKTYKYLVQVRMANPNFGKKEEVAFPALADIKELPPSDLTETPTISIPGEYHLYAVDQKPAFKVPNGSDYETPKENWKQEQVAVQIHRWVDESRTQNGNFVIGDWCVAERLYIRRGDAVGKPINVEVPTWNSDENRFELGKAVGAGGAKQIVVPKKGLFVPAMPAVPGPPAANTGGVQVNFATTMPPPVLVDFDGGKREFRISTTTPKVQDESMSNLLILRADGSLIVRNTKIDSETGTAAGKERLQRIETWLLKTLPLRVGPAGPGGPGMPMNPGGIFNRGA